MGTTPARSPVDLPTRRTSTFDPAPELAALRGQGSACRLRFSDGHLGWLVTGYELGRAVLNDPRFRLHRSRNAVGDPLPEAPSDAGTPDRRHRYLESHAAFKSGSLFRLDPPEHTRLRRLQTPHFTDRHVADRRGQIEQIANARLDAMAEIGPPLDLVHAFALPFASLVLCAELGVDGSERRFFEEPSATIDDPRSTQDERMDALSSFADYVRAVIERKRARPGDDLLSHLLASGDLTEDELVGISLTLFGAGHAPLANMVSLSTFFLLCDGRRGWDEARRHLEAPPGLVEELLRYLTVVQTGSFTRTAVEDVELGDFAVRAGESVCVSFAAANRDPSKFPDPDRFDPSRQTKGHMAFGYGRHMCLGQHLARRELAVALRGLMEQFPTLRLVPDPTTVRVTAGEHPLYGVDELVVTW